ncbi:hypothetical protein TraAM80_09245 [Trypanosoma rangeli]|uniref:Uncharacterized protein n=1 Tax=Trypanosoma rangeli TaxID=5698 RepID=A0A3R7MZH0_TRYRA|nr:uncharacterized protein TraAM80_09245 [Trypanosoma rangeli]RNE97618.1 hypothetical protein TraAM80_09245 [Trypanosoma rangeli]|eukprot:RNE97618.1 hypothetical protein TraAM80_09245 [Trypanosoma rangeli]
MLVRGGCTSPLWPAGAAYGAVEVLLRVRRLRTTRAAAACGREALGAEKAATHKKCGHHADGLSFFRFVVPAERPVYALSRGRFFPRQGGKQQQTAGVSDMSRPEQSGFGNSAGRRRA